MKAIPSIASILVGLALSAWIAVRVVPAVPNPAGGGGGDARQGHYHPGKTAQVFRDSAGCVSPGCHVPSPHRRQSSHAAFRNLHARHADCLVCHASGGTARVAAARGESGRGELRFRGAAPPIRPDGHPVLGQPPGCRGCHSDAGARMLKGAGLDALPSGFADPIALKMLEGGARSWNP